MLVVGSPWESGPGGTFHAESQFVDKKERYHHSLVGTVSSAYGVCRDIGMYADHSWHCNGELARKSPRMMHARCICRSYAIYIFHAGKLMPEIWH